ncbi:sugar ABC transporter substrate-binding protein [Planctomycetota bacterium]
MDEQNSRRASRRGLLKQVAAGAGLGMGALLVGCRPDRQRGAGPRRGRRRLKAAFFSTGLTGSRNTLGRDTAKLWGELLDVDVKWFDGELDGEKQREKIESIVDGEWDFCALQALQPGILEEPVKQLKKRRVPVISMDAHLVERARLRDVGVWVKIAPDHVYMAEISAQYLMDKINGQGKVIHIGGRSDHSGALDREKGFNNVVQQYPDVEVVGGGVRWCDWNAELARTTFAALLEESTEPIAGAFFHNDDMALAGVSALAGTRHESMVVTAVDGQKAGLAGVREGKLAATAVNPTCMIHGWSLIIGQFIVRNQEQVEDLPLEIICPSPLAARDAGNLDAMSYLADPKHCLV